MTQWFIVEHDNPWMSTYVMVLQPGSIKPGFYTESIDYHSNCNSS